MSGREPYYFEVTINGPSDSTADKSCEFIRVQPHIRKYLETNNLYSIIGIGFYKEYATGNRMVGWDEGSWGFHGDNGRIYGQAPWGLPYATNIKVGDVVGCGVEFSPGGDGKASFVKNKENLGGFPKSSTKYWS